MDLVCALNLTVLYVLDAQNIVYNNNSKKTSMVLWWGVGGGSLFGQYLRVAHDVAEPSLWCRSGGEFSLLLHSCALKMCHA